MQQKICFRYPCEDHLTLTAAPDNCRAEVRCFQTANFSPPRLKESRYGREEKNKSQAR